MIVYRDPIGSPVLTLKAAPVYPGKRVFVCDLRVRVVVPAIVPQPLGKRNLLLRQDLNLRDPVTGGPGGDPCLAYNPLDKRPLQIGIRLPIHSHLCQSLL